MRAVTPEEIDRIAGGYGNEEGQPPPPPPPPTLDPILVTASNLQAFQDMYPVYMARFGDWIFNQGFAVALGGDGPGNSDTTEQEEVNALKALGEELQVLALHGEIPSDWVEQGVDIANLSASFLSADLSGGKTSWTIYADTGFSPNPGTSYANTPINWNTFDWSEIPGAKDAPNYEAALEDAVHWAQSHER